MRREGWLWAGLGRVYRDWRKCLVRDRGGDRACQGTEKAIWQPYMGRTSRAERAYGILTDVSHRQSISYSCRLPHVSPASSPPHALPFLSSSTSSLLLSPSPLRPGVVAMSYGRCQRHYRCHPRRRPCIRTVSSTKLIFRARSQRSPFADYPAQSPHKPSSTSRSMEEMTTDATS